MGSAAEDTGDGAVLMVRSGPNSGAAIRLSSGTITLGRAHDNDIVLDEAVVSRRHAAVVRKDVDYHLRDLGSKNGTFLNGRRIGNKEHLLQHGDEIHIGGSNILLVFLDP